MAQTTQSQLHEIWDRKNIIYSANDALSFQITGTINKCGVRLHKTTDDLLILFENDKQAKEHQHIEVAPTKQHSTDNTTSIISFSPKTTLKIQSLETTTRKNRSRHIQRMLHTINTTPNNSKRRRYLQPITRPKRKRTNNIHI